MVVAMASNDNTPLVTVKLTEKSKIQHFEALIRRLMRGEPPINILDLSNIMIYNEEKEEYDHLNSDQLEQLVKALEESKNKDIKIKMPDKLSDSPDSFYIQHFDVFKNERFAKIDPELDKFKEADIHKAKKYIEENKEKKEDIKYLKNLSNDHYKWCRVIESLKTKRGTYVLAMETGSYGIADKVSKEIEELEKTRKEIEERYPKENIFSLSDENIEARLKANIELSKNEDFFAKYSELISKKEKIIKFESNLKFLQGKSVDPLIVGSQNQINNAILELNKVQQKMIEGNKALIAKNAENKDTFSWTWTSSRLLPQNIALIKQALKDLTNLRDNIKGPEDIEIAKKSLKKLSAKVGIKSLLGKESFALSNELKGIFDKTLRSLESEQFYKTPRKQY